ncbi:MAG: helix-turn-helix domain-containing protein [Treponema sp.]|nr:helix-turn-helix domain-containing protein [Treponema sp.]
MEKSFKDNLRDELNYQDITVKELSLKTGIPKPTLSCYLSARNTMPPADIAVRIAKSLNVSVEYLVTGNDTQPPASEDESCLHFLIEDLKTLDCTKLQIISTMVHALVEEK